MLMGNTDSLKRVELAPYELSVEVTQKLLLLPGSPQGRGCPFPRRPGCPAQSKRHLKRKRHLSFSGRLSGASCLGLLRRDFSFLFFTRTWAGEDLIPVVSKVKQNVPKVRLNEKANPWFPSSLQSSKHLFPMDGKSSSSPGVIAEC